MHKESVSSLSSDTKYSIDQDERNNSNNMPIAIFSPFIIDLTLSGGYKGSDYSVDYNFDKYESNKDKKYEAELDSGRDDKGKNKKTWDRPRFW